MGKPRERLATPVAHHLIHTGPLTSSMSLQLDGFSSRGKTRPKAAGAVCVISTRYFEHKRHWPRTGP